MHFSDNKIYSRYPEEERQEPKTFHLIEHWKWSESSIHKSLSVDTVSNSNVTPGVGVGGGPHCQQLRQAPCPDDSDVCSQHWQYSSLICYMVTILFSVWSHGHNTHLSLFTWSQYSAVIGHMVTILSCDWSHAHNTLLWLVAWYRYSDRHRILVTAAIWAVCLPGPASMLMGQLSRHHLKRGAFSPFIYFQRYNLVHLELDQTFFYRANR